GALQSGHVSRSCNHRGLPFEATQSECRNQLEHFMFGKNRAPSRHRRTLVKPLHQLKWINIQYMGVIRQIGIDITPHYRKRAEYGTVRDRVKDRGPHCEADLLDTSVVDSLKRQTLQIHRAKQQRQLGKVVLHNARQNQHITGSIVTEENTLTTVDHIEMGMPTAE